MDIFNLINRYLKKHAKLAKEQGTPESKIFQHLHFTILGLGDSDYSSFQKCPKEVYNCFETLGAKFFHYFAKADEAVSLEMEIEPWLESFWEALPKAVNEVKSEKIDWVRRNTTMVKEESKIVKEVEEEEEQEKPTIKAKISKKHIEADKYRKVVRFDLELDREITAEDDVKPGSYVLVYPKNDSELVDKFIQYCNWTKTDKLVDDLTNHLDFLAPVNSKLQDMLLKYSPKELHVGDANVLSAYDFLEYIQPKESVSEDMLELIPKLKARFYSLASDLIDTSKFEVCFTLEVHEQHNVFEEGHTVQKRGVCSNYLNRVYEQGDGEFELKLNKFSKFPISKEQLQEKVPMM